MRLTAGNAAILGRSPRIFVFTAGQPRGSYRFEGRFEYIAHTLLDVTIPNRSGPALVFQLRKVADAVNL